MKCRELGKLLVWLEWDIASFKLNAHSLAYLERMVEGRFRLVRVKSERAFLRELPEAEVALVWFFQAPWYAKAKKLRVLATPAAGRELVAQQPPPGVQLHHGHFHGAIMAETALALMLAWCRGLVSAARDFPGDPWPRKALSPHCYLLAGTRAVVLGYGNVGRAIGATLERNGVVVKGITRRNLGELEGALRTADWLVLALPGDTGTDRIIDAHKLALMKRSAAIVNVGRGNAIDEVALAAALKRRRIAAALLDVFADEPLRADSPLAGDLPGLVRLPHASAFAPTYLMRFFDELKKEGIL